MKHFLALVKARNMEFVRDRGTFYWNILFPIVLVFGFAFAFGGNGGPLFKVGILGPETPALSALKIDQVNFIDYDHASPPVSKEAVLEHLRQHELDLVIDTSAHTFYLNSESKSAPIVRRLFASDLSAQGFSELKVSGAPIRYVDRLVPGVIGMNIMFSCLFGVGWVIVRYRKNGVLKRLKATPVSAFSFVASQVVSRLVIVVLTAVVVYFGTDIFLHFLMKGSYFDLLLITALGILSMISLGLLFATRFKSEELTNGLLNLVLFPMLIFSGVFFSLEGTPALLQDAAQIFPLTHFVNGARTIMLEGGGLKDILPDLLFLSGFSAVALALSAWLFRWE